MSTLHHVLVGLGSVVCVLAGVVFLNVAWQLFWPKDPKHPPIVFHYVPVFGCAASYGMDPYKFMFDNRTKYGPVFTYPMLGKWMTATLGPLGSDFVLNGRLQHVNAEMAYTHLTTPVFGTEVVYDCPNSVLMEQKKFVKYGLTTERFKKYVGLIKGEVVDYFTKHVFENDTKKEVSVDAFSVSSEITICTASATLQGKEIREAMDKSFAQLYHDLDGGFTPLNFVFPNLPLPSYRRRDVAQKTMSDFYVSILERRRASTDEPEEDMLSSLQDQEYKDGQKLTDRQIAHIMIALLMAGQHTSAATGSWAILHLGDRPDVMKDLYDEQVKFHGDGKGGFKPLEYETLSTPLLSAFIKEVLRLHPPLHSIMRYVLSDYPVPATLSSPSSVPGVSATKAKQLEGTQFVIPKGNYILAAPGVSMMDPKIWGEDCMEFNEKRWFDGGVGSGLEKEEDQGEEDYGWGKISKGGKSAYLPFGAGRHRCIGEQFANLQIGTIVATMVRNYDWKIDNSWPENDYNTMIVMPKAPRTCTFKKRA